MTDSEREQVLRMIQDGKISAEEGLRLIQALEAAPPDDADEAPGIIPEAPAPPPPSDNPARREFQSRINRLRRLWLIPLALGMACALPGAWWMFQNVQAGLNGWFIFPFLFFLLGVGLIALGVGSRTARWIYVNIKEKEDGAPFRIVFAFPIPTGLVRWGIKNFGHHMPDRQRAVTNDVLKAIFESDALNEPILVDVKEADDRHVRIYIG